MSSDAPDASFWMPVLLLLLPLGFSRSKENLRASFLLGRRAGDVVAGPSGASEADMEFRRLKESDRNNFLPARLVIFDEEASEGKLVPATPPREFLR
jgi:hypothetical protein